MFQGSFKGVPRKFLVFFKEVSRVFQESFKGVSRKIEGCFNGVLREIQGCLKEFQWMFKARFQRCFKDDPFICHLSNEICHPAFNDVSRKIEECFKGVLSGFQGYLKEVQRNFKEV